jgi:hypothetical protein
MTALSIQPTFPIFTDIDGQPLEAGYIFIGVANLAPIGNPINVYWDAALTLAAAQPIRTIGGYPVNAGTPARLYVNSDYSIQVQNRNGSVVYSAPAATERLSGVVIEIDSTDVSFIQAGTGAVTRTAQAKMRETVSVLDFGADPTGVADSTTAIQNAITAAVSAGAQVVAQGTFRTSSKITVKCDADFSGAIFNVYGTPAIAVEISTGSATNPTDNLFNVNVRMPLEINNMTKPGTGWVGQGIGVRTVNLNSCRVFFNQIKNFATGLLVTAYSEGNAYNDYHIGALINNQINLQLYGSDVGGYVNENNFYGGRYFFYSAEGTNVSGTRHISIPTALSATGIQNNNVFYKPSVEGDTPEYHIENAGQYNTFIQGRYESSPSKVLYVGDTAAKGTYNVIAGGYTAGNIVFSYSGSSSSFDNQVNLVPDRNLVSGSSLEGVFRYRNSNGSADPIQTFYAAGTNPTAATSTQWTMRHSATQLKGKQTADVHERVKIDYQNGVLFLGNGVVSPVAYFGNNTVTQLGVYAIDGFVPLADNLIFLGRSNLRWSEVYAANGTINTSDAREKQQIRDLSAAERAVAVRLKSLIKAFKFNDAVQRKGDDARTHVGVIAQEVKVAFHVEGLDAHRYGILCYDEWEEQPESLKEDGSVSKPRTPAGNRYGIRYEQLLAFIISAL